MKDLIERYRAEPDLLALLKAVQARHGGLTALVTARLATELGLPEGELYGVATFYAFLSRQPRGRHTIRVCRCLPCGMRDAPRVLGTIGQYLGIRPGQTTPDGRFTLQVVNCIGACDVAPAMLVDGQRFGNLTPARAVEALGAFK
ncbi:MAG: NADH-quinone oxidoreductase subunit NuoE family protein [Chloroflexota bacterium]